jgi:hypothetical protein
MPILAADGGRKCSGPGRTRYWVIADYSPARGLKNENIDFLTISTFYTLSFSRALCNLAEGPPLRNLGPL